jgi:PAS domain S-box-containing protein
MSTKAVSTDNKSREPRDLARSVFVALPDLVIVLDEHDVVVDYSPGDGSLIGLPESAVLGKPVHTVLESAAADISSLAETARTTGRIETAECDLSADGRPHHLEARCSPLGERRVVVVLREITTRRQVEADLRRAEEQALRGMAFRETIIRTAAEGIAVYAILNEFPFVQFFHWNDRMTEITGYTMEEINALGWHRTLYPDPDVRAQAFTRLEHIRQGARMRKEEWTITHKDGSTRTITVSSSIVEDDDGQRVVVSLYHDVTDQRRAEAESRRLERAMLQAQKMESLGLLAGGVAHDFNNLLTSVLGYAGLAKDALDARDPALEMVTEIEHAAERAVDLARQMLAYSGRGQLIVETVALNVVVAEMKRLLETVIPKDVAVSLSLDPALVRGDATQIRQIVMNLITNAAEAIEGEGRIAIRTGVGDMTAERLHSPFVHDDIPAGAYAWVEVEDTGCGMDEATLARIFDPFFSTKFTGRGIGLAAVLGIVRGHRGTIRVTSAPGEGTTFLVLLPADQGPLARHMTPAHGRHSGAMVGTVLVIDDDAGVRGFVSKVLEHVGVRVLSASDGRSGLDLFVAHEHEIMAVLVDFMMPRLDGLQVADRLRDRAPRLPVLVMSGYNELDVESRRERGLAGFGFIQKPFRASELVSRLAEVLPATEEPS